MGKKKKAKQVSSAKEHRRIGIEFNYMDSSYYPEEPCPICNSKDMTCILGAIPIEILTGKQICDSCAKKHDPEVYAAIELFSAAYSLNRAGPDICGEPAKSILHPDLVPY